MSEHQFKLYCLDCKSIIEEETVDGHLNENPSHNLVEVITDETAPFQLRADISSEDSDNTDIENLIYSEEELSTNNNDVWYPKLELSFTPSKTEKHIVHWYAEYQMSKNNKKTMIQVNQDDTVLAETILISHKKDIYFGTTGLAIVDLVKDDEYTFVLRFKLLDNKTTLYIRRARLFIRRLL